MLKKLAEIVTVDPTSNLDRKEMMVCSRDGGRLARELPTKLVHKVVKVDW